MKNRKVKTKLRVNADIWATSLWIVHPQRVGGKRRDIGRIQEARDFAERNGYTGIHIHFTQDPKRGGRTL